MGGACNTYGEREERFIQGFGREDLREKRPPGVDGRMILRWLFRKWDVGRDCIDLAQDRDRWRALVNAAVNLRVP